MKGNYPALGWGCVEIWGDCPKFPHTPIPWLSIYNENKSYLLATGHLEMGERMDERFQLEQAIEHLEAQRATLGDAVVETALAPLREKLAALDKSPERVMAGERKLVTVMFADLSGFTALAEHMDPEAVRDLMNDCFAQLVPSPFLHFPTVRGISGHLRKQIPNHEPWLILFRRFGTGIPAPGVFAQHTCAAVLI